MRPIALLRAYGLRVGLVVAAWIFMVQWVPTFRGEASIFASLEYLPLLGLIAVALTIPMVAGEFDLSVGSMAALGGVVAVLASPNGLVVAIVAGALVGGLIGCLQGYSIARLPITSVAFTIGSLIVLRGVTYALADNRAVPIEDLLITDPLFVRYGVFTASSLVALALVVVLGLAMTYTRRGREIHAIGGGRKEAAAIGVSVTRSLVVAFTLSGAVAGLAGALTTMKGGTADPGSYDGTLLTGIAAILIGGVSLAGGKGTVFHALLGTLLLAVISAGLSFRGETPATVSIVSGVVLLIVVAGTRVTSAVETERKIRRLARSASAPAAFTEPSLR